MQNRFSLTHSIILTVILTVIFSFIQYSGVFSISGINPNLILIFPLFLLLRKENIYLFFVSILSFGALTFLFSKFWIFDVLASVLLLILIFFIRGFFTGNKALDFILITAGISVIFSLILNFSDLADISIFIAIGGVFYNVFIAVVMILWKNLFNAR